MLFKHFHQMPRVYYGLPYFERMVVRSFLHVHIEEENEAAKEIERGLRRGTNA